MFLISGSNGDSFEGAAFRGWKVDRCKTEEMWKTLIGGGRWGKDGWS